MKNSDAIDSRFRPSLLARIHSKFWGPNEGEETVSPSANDLIRLVFDSLRNIGITLGVGYGSYQMSLLAARTTNKADASLLNIFAGAAYVATCCLTLLCLIYALNFLKTTSWNRQSKHPFFWLMAFVLPLFLAFLLVFVAFLISRTGA